MSVTYDDISKKIVDMTEPLEATLHTLSANPHGSPEGIAQAKANLKIVEKFNHETIPALANKITPQPSTSPSLTRGSSSSSSPKE